MFGENPDLDDEALRHAVSVAVETALYETVWNYGVDESTETRQVENWSEVVASAVTAYLAVSSPVDDAGPDTEPVDIDPNLPCYCPMSDDEDVDRTLFWSGDCPAHGVESDWYNSPEQAERRRRDERRSGARKLAVKARRRRHLVLACGGCGEDLRVRRIGCLVCDEDKPAVAALIEELSTE